MNTIIGQNKLVEKLKSYSFNKMPKTLLFIGDKGSGRHYISKCFAKYLMVDLVELTAQTTTEQLIELYQTTTQKICLLDLSTVTEKQQNKYLKFIEEPTVNIRIILIAESEVGILPTILNRCIKYTLEDYSISQLKQFSWAAQLDNPLIYELCNTPGQLLEASNIENLEAMQQACTNLILNLPTVFTQTLVLILSVPSPSPILNSIKWFSPTPSVFSSTFPISVYSVLGLNRSVL